MSRESIMRSLGLFNMLWDGAVGPVDRRKEGGSFTLSGARLTMALQVQELALRAFVDSAKGLARGMGFLSRFLTSWPTSTQGTRFFADPPPEWPASSTFNRRISAILSNPAPLSGDGTLAPLLLEFTPEAKRAWAQFHDAVEVELGVGGELCDVRDVASKTADNAARLAALFHVFQHGSTGSIDYDCFVGASRIVAWHLRESSRFFGELAMPKELVNVQRLDAWLLDYCKREATHEVPMSAVQQYGPGGLRSKDAIETTVRELKERGRAIGIKRGRNKFIAVNPKLLGREGSMNISKISNFSVSKTYCAKFGRA